MSTPHEPGADAREGDSRDALSVQGDATTDAVEEETQDMPDGASLGLEVTGVARVDRAPLVDTVIEGRYRIQERLGRGGMGEVYLAEHISIEKPVAIKLLRPDVRETEDLRKRFLREARAASKIRHEHVVDITDYGETKDGLTYFVMEYLEGEDLAALLEREAPLPWRRARALALQVLRALAAAHAEGIIHRDMKPANCFRIRRFDSDDFIKVLDFGIAKRAVDDDAPSETTSVTERGAVIGTAAYMPPEQALAQPLDARADLYAFGVMLFKMLSGRLPFTGPSSMAVIAKHLHDPPPALRAPAESRPIPDALAALVDQLLAKDPAHRPASAAAVIDALEAIEPDSPTTDRGSQGALAPVAEEPARPRWRPALIGLLALGVTGVAAAAYLRDDAPAASPGGDSVARATEATTVDAYPGAREASATTSATSEAPTTDEPATPPDAGASAETEAAPAKRTPSTPSPRAQVERFRDRKRRAIRGCFDSGGEFRTELRARVTLTGAGRLESLELLSQKVELRTRRCLEELFRKLRVTLDDEARGSARARVVELTLRR
ncbi:MAG: protein kinase [Myxococcales bacterium]|nr:protein kinase [Myxococcales bacterium]